MSCPVCGSIKCAEFSAEIMIHFSGRSHLTHPGVLVFPKILVCSDCDFSQFTIAERELALIRGVPTRLSA